MSKSNCCNELVTVQGNTTKYFVCNKCGEACDEVSNIGMLRQWLNEYRITDPNKMVTNEQIIKFLK